MLTDIIDDLSEENDMEVNIAENFEDVSISLKSKKFLKLKTDCIANIKSSLNSRDELIDFIINISGYPIILDDEKEFWEDYEQSIQNSDGEIVECELKIIIKKRINENIVSIYWIESFCSFLEGMNCAKCLSILYSKKYLNFEVIQSSDISCFSNMYCFFSDGVQKQKTFNEEDSRNLLDSQSQNCSFANRSNIKFEPNNFKLNGNYIQKLYGLFERLRLIIMLTYIFDISEINEDVISLQLSGKSIERFYIDYKEIDIERLTIYYEIFNWIYQGDNVVDKLIISRNVLIVNLHLKMTIEIPKNILAIIKSNYKIYTNNNYEKYAAAKTTAINNLLNVQKQIMTLSDGVTDKFIKNITMICTFIFTVIIVNSISNGKFSDIFTKDVTLISIGLIILSIIFLRYTLFEIKIKLKNLESLQSNINIIYSDILSKDTLNELTVNNEYYINTKEQIYGKIQKYRRLWITVIITCSVLVVILGWKHFNYVWNWIIEYLSRERKI